MKKMLAILLALTMLCGMTAAMAEPMTVELVENGTWVQFTDYNMQVCLPSDWLELELTDDQTAAGYLYACVNPEQTRSFAVKYSELDAATDIETVASELAAAYANVSTLTINDINFVTYDITESDLSGLATLGGSGVGLYCFEFMPASDAEYGPLAISIAASICSIE